jgi:hypothetical protein
MPLQLARTKTDFSLVSAKKYLFACSKSLLNSRESGLWRRMRAVVNRGRFLKFFENGRTSNPH